jgi:hypothetical protein
MKVYGSGRRRNLIMQQYVEGEGESVTSKEREKLRNGRKAIVTTITYFCINKCSQIIS